MSVGLHWVSIGGTGQAVAESSGPGEFTADDLGRAWSNPERGHHAADDYRREDSAAEYCEPGEGAAVHSATAGDRPAQKDADPRTVGVTNVVPTFEVRSRKLQRYSIWTAEVGLTRG